MHDQNKLLNTLKKGGELSHREREDLKNYLNLDSANLDYFLILIDQNNKNKGISLPIWTGESTKQKNMIFPGAICPKHLLETLPITQLKDLESNKEHYLNEAKKIALWFRPMQAGSGSSIKRQSYLDKRAGKVDVPLGAKGTDLYAPVNNSDREVSLAEIHLIRCSNAAKEKIFGEMIFGDIVGPETKHSIDQLWQTKTYTDATKSYNDLVENIENFYHLENTQQAHLPTINENGHFSCTHKAPAGHGFFGYDSLSRGIDQSLPLPDSKLP
ncbi:hypothetical protein OAB57_03935, partial [Bacteriovoracaceae bacterium]|nr:hypothetical protein [Bacteriovoracaceae bacterium]